MFRYKKIISIILSSMLLSSCTNQSTNDVQIEPPTITAISQSPYSIEDISFSIKTDNKVTGTSVNDGDYDKNADILNKLVSDFKTSNIENVVLYENFTDNSDLVVLYTNLYKIVLGEYRDGKLTYIPLPTEDLLTKVSTLEGFDTYEVDTFPKDFLDFIYTRFQQNKYNEVIGKLLTTDYPTLSPEEIDKWVEYYADKNGDVDPYLERYAVETAYKFDFNNDSILDIMFITTEGSGHYAHDYILQGVGADEYIISHDGSLTGDFHFIAPFSYRGVNYTFKSITFEDSSIVSTCISYVTNTGDNTNTQTKISVSNYLSGYKITNTWTADGYYNLEDYMVSRLDLANIPSHSVMGTAETTTTLDNGEFVDTYSVTGDYNNDGKDDSMEKIYGYFGNYSGFIVVNTTAQTLNNALDSLEDDGISIDTPSVFLDKTEYGNLLFVTYGSNERLYKLNVFKLTGETSQLVGTINLEQINLTKIEQYPY